jgi:membrane protein DedA with SNARE-associated domain
MDPAAIVGLAALLFVKEAGVPVPVPGDLLVLGAGVAAAGDPGVGAVTLAAILGAGYAGGGLQFLLVRGKLRLAIVGLLVRFGVPRDRIEALANRLRRGGACSVAVARATPGVRIGAVAASGLAGLPLPVFATGLVVGNTVFVGGHFMLGLAVGVPALGAIQAAGGVMVAVVVVLGLAALGAAGWMLVRRRRVAGGPPSIAPAMRGGEAGLAAWADAACPACLALAVATHAPSDGREPGG